MRGIAYDEAFRALMMGLHSQGRSLVDLSREFQVPRDVLSRWWSRYREEGLEGLTPHSRRPQHSPHQKGRKVERQILALRREGLGPARIALAVPASRDDGSPGAGPSWLKPSATQAPPGHPSLREDEAG